MELTHYADDTTVSLMGDNNRSILDIIVDDLKQIQQWLQMSHLTMNTSKSSYMMIGPKCSKFSPLISGTNINLNDKILVEVTDTEFLGITIDGTLTFKSQYRINPTRLSMATYNLYQSNWCVPKNLLRVVGIQHLLIGSLYGV